MTDPGHQQRTVISQLLHARRHMVKRTRHRADFRGAILTQRRRNNAAPDLQRRVLQIHQRAVLNTNKQPGAAYRQQHDRQGIAEQRREVALMDLGQRHPHPDIGRQPGLQPHHRGAFIDLYPHLCGATKLMGHLLT